MKFTHNIISKYFFFLMLLLFTSVHSSAIAGDATSFDPTSVAVEPKAISGVPIGGVIPWPAGAVPEGFLECNGQSTAGYADLAAIVGGTVPDLRGEFIRGWDHGRGADSGRSIKSSQSSAMESHSHQTTITVSGSGVVRGATKSMMVSAAGFLTGSGTPSNQAISFSASGTGTSTAAGSGSDNRPRNVAMMYIIKAE